MSTTVWPTIAEAISHARHTSVAPLTWDPVNHLLSRFTFGPTAAGRASLTKSGPDAWYENELAKATKLKAQGNEYGWDAMDQLTQVTIGRQG